MKNLQVNLAYTTNNGGDNTGAITLYCTVGGKEITVRTSKLYDAQGNLVTQDYFVGKTIDVKGIVDFYNGNAQIAVYLLDNIVVR